jgi:hypothetical protein
MLCGVLKFDVLFAQQLLLHSIHIYTHKLIHTYISYAYIHYMCRYILSISINTCMHIVYLYIHIKAYLHMHTYIYTCIYIIYKYTYIDIYNTLYICEIYFCNKGISTCAYIHTKVNHTVYNIYMHVYIIYKYTYTHIYIYI